MLFRSHLKNPPAPTEYQPLLILESPLVSAADLANDCTSSNVPCLPGASYLMQVAMRLAFWNFDPNQDDYLELLVNTDLHMPIMLLLKVDDPVIPFTTIEKLTSILQTKNLPLYIVPIRTKEEHGFLTKTYIAKVIYHAFLKAHNFTCDESLAKLGKNYLATALRNGQVATSSNWEYFDDKPKQD